MCRPSRTESDQVDAGPQVVNPVSRGLTALDGQQNVHVLHPVVGGKSPIVCACCALSSVSSTIHTVGPGVMRNGIGAGSDPAPRLWSPTRLCQGRDALTNRSARH